MVHGSIVYCKNLLDNGLTFVSFLTPPISMKATIVNIWSTKLYLGVVLFVLYCLSLLGPLPT
jgi:hypothetical protein